MKRQKDYIATGLLIVFAFGGIGGPLAHGILHTLEREATKARHEHAHSKDGTPSLATAAAPFWALTECVLCAPLVFDVPPIALAPDEYPFNDCKCLRTEIPVHPVDSSSSHARAPPASA